MIQHTKKIFSVPPEQNNWNIWRDMANISKLGPQLPCPQEGSIGRVANFSLGGEDLELQWTPDYKVAWTKWMLRRVDSKAWHPAKISKPCPPQASSKKVTGISQLGVSNPSGKCRFFFLIWNRVQGWNKTKFNSIYLYTTIFCFWLLLSNLVFVGRVLVCVCVWGGICIYLKDRRCKKILAVHPFSCITIPSHIYKNRVPHVHKHGFLQHTYWALLHSIGTLFSQIQALYPTITMSVLQNSLFQSLLFGDPALL